MSEFDIEKFPTSEAAKRMMSTISEEFYGDSYVMKWIQQVMGMEWDDAVRIIEEELPKQFFPETATWGLCYHEIKWQLPIRENLSYEERRKLIYQKRDFKAPMTPYKMEEYIQKITGTEVHVMDCHDSGEVNYVPNHPNVFKVFFLNDGEELVRRVISIIQKIKQSHTGLEELSLKPPKDISLPLVVRSGIAVEETVTVFCEKEETDVKI